MAKKNKHNKSSKGITITAVVLLSLTAAIIGVKTYSDINGGIIIPLSDSSYVISTEEKSYSMTNLDINEKMYIKNEANLDLSEITSIDTYRSATLSSLINTNYTLENYLEDNSNSKLYSVENVRLEQNEEFTITNKELGNLLENDDVELIINDYILTAGSDMLTTSVKYDFVAKYDGSYNFYLIENEKNYELLVNYTIPKGYTGTNAYFLPSSCALVGGMNNWTVDNLDYLMNKSINNIFSFDLEVTSDSLEFKIVADQSWDKSYGGANLITVDSFVQESYGNIKITQPGLYKIKVNVLTGEVSVEQTEYYDYNYHLTLVGAMNDWDVTNDDYVLTKSSTPGLFEISYMNFEIMSEYQTIQSFKIVLDNSWNKQFGYYQLDNDSKEYIGLDGDDNIYFTSVGEYLIRLNMKTGKISIEFTSILEFLTLYEDGVNLANKTYVLDCVGICEKYIELISNGTIELDTKTLLWTIEIPEADYVDNRYITNYSEGIDYVYLTPDDVSLFSKTYYAISVKTGYIGSFEITDDTDIKFTYIHPEFKEFIYIYDGI